jgi:putative ABC transport system substrate-binding protein
VPDSGRWASLDDHERWCHAPQHDEHDRRTFLTGSLSLLAAPLGAQAQQAGKVYRVGYLGVTATPVVAAFVAGMREYGYTEGVNLKLEYRWAGGRDDVWVALVRELVKAGVHVVVATSSPATLTLKEHAPDVPVVFVGVSQPVELGLVQSLARPGGQITGLSGQHGDLVTKVLQLCGELVPSMSRLAVFWTPSNQGSALALKSMQSAATKAGIAIVPVSTRTQGETDSALSTLERERPQVVLVHASYAGSPEMPRILEFTLGRRIPTVGSGGRQAHDGVLMSYSADLETLYRRPAYYVDRILRGTKPADLPVEQPTKFELVINLKTAKALGVTIPPSLLQRADQVIE